MGLVSGKIIVVLLLLFVSFGWALGNGYVSWAKSPYECLGGKRLTPVGEKLDWLWIGSLHLKYQAYKWGCDADHMYDPRVYLVENGVLVTRPNATPH
jgi:hypothetical protein